VHVSETLLAPVTLNCFILAVPLFPVLAELVPALAVAEPLGALADAWPPGPLAVAVLPELMPAPALFAVFGEVDALAEEPSIPVT
jgi:hypothetical protein